MVCCYVGGVGVVFTEVLTVFTSFFVNNLIGVQLNSLTLRFWLSTSSSLSTKYWLGLFIVYNAYRIWFYNFFNGDFDKIYQKVFICLRVWIICCLLMCCLIYDCRSAWLSGRLT